MQSYDIFWKNRKVGYAYIYSEGLYSQIDCTCSFETPGIYRIVVRGDHNNHRLGVCVPFGNNYVLKKKVPSKHLNSNNFCFEVQCDTVSEDQKILITHSICEIPISMLQKMRLKREEGNVYLVIS